MGLLSRTIEDVDYSLYIGRHLGNHLYINDFKKDTLYLSIRQDVSNIMIDNRATLKENEGLSHIRKLHNEIPFKKVDFQDNFLDIIALSHIGTDFGNMHFKSSKGFSLNSGAQVNCLIRNLKVDAPTFSFQKLNNSITRIKNFEVNTNVFRVYRNAGMDKFIFLDDVKINAKCVIMTFAVTEKIDAIINKIKEDQVLDLSLIDQKLGKICNGAHAFVSNSSQHFATVIYDSNHVIDPPEECQTSSPTKIAGSWYSCDVVFDYKIENFYRDINNFLL